MTQDVILTLSLVLVAALVARFLASLLRVPEILLWWPWAPSSDPPCSTSWTRRSTR